MFLIVLVNFSELESVEVDIFTNKNNRIVFFLFAIIGSFSLTYFETYLINFA